MNGSYRIAYEETLKKMGKDFPYFSMIVVSLYGLLNKFSDYQDIVLDVFHKTKIIIEEDTVVSIMKKNHFDIDDYFEGNETMNNDNYIVPAISSNGNFLLMNYQNEIEIYREQPFIICGESSQLSKTILLHSFIHEFCHLIKSHVHDYIQEEDEWESSHYLRCGLHFYKNSINKKDGSFQEGDYFSSIDEVINVIQTTEVLEIIQGLDGIVPDIEIQNYIDSLDKKVMERDYGYERAVKAFRPLWEIESFRSIIENNIVEGNLDEIVTEINSLSTTYSFSDLVFAVENIDDLKNNTDNDSKKSKQILFHIYQDIKRNLKMKRK